MRLLVCHPILLQLCSMLLKQNLGIVCMRAVRCAACQVGRGARASSCYLVTGERGALDRLAIMERSQDGFIIAQADLDHRCASGPAPGCP